MKLNRIIEIDGQYDFPLVTRVELVDDGGRVFYARMDGVKALVQDNGRTLKILYQSEAGHAADARDLEHIKSLSSLMREDAKNRGIPIRDQ